MQDRRQDKMTDGPQLAQVFFWPGEDRLAHHLATLIKGTALPQDAMTHSRGGQRALVLWRGPDHHLSVCLTMGHSVARALTDWKTAARGLLIQSRQNRRTLVLAEAEALRRGGLGPLADRLGPLSLPDMTDDLAPAPATLPLAQALAQLALTQDADLRSLLDDLTAASLPAPGTDLPDLMEQVAHDNADRARAADLAARQADDLTSQIGLLQDALSQQALAEQARAQAATLHADSLQAQLAAQDLDLARLRADLATHGADADLLLTQVQLGDTALTRHLTHGQARSDADSLRILTLETQLSLSEAEAAARQTLIAQRDADLAKAASAMDLHRTQLALAQDELARAVADNATQSQATSLRISALEGQLSLHTRDLAARQAELADQRAKTSDAADRLSHATAELDLHRSQLGLAQDGLARQLPKNATNSQAAALRIATLEGQLSLQSHDLAAGQAELATLRATLSDLTDRLSHATAELDLHRSQLGLAQGAVAQQTFADHADQVTVLTAQIALLQSDLTHVLMTPPRADAAAPAVTDADHWDKALARALAAARSEADQRARLEKELATLRAAAQGQTRRSEDQALNRKMFTQMTRDAAAALDDIARLSGPGRAAGQVAPE